MTKSKNKRHTKEEMEVEKRTTSSSSTPMDPTIWSKLPEDILLQVMALLPLHSLISLRPTCRRFSSLLSTPSFLSLHHHHHLLPHSDHHHHLLLLSHPQFYSSHLPSLSPSTSTWRTLHLPPSPSLRLLSSSSGLLCFSHHRKSPSLLLTNPLTCSSRTLLAPANPILSATILPYRSSPPHGYRLLVTTLSPKWVFLYDSLTASWSKIRGTHVALVDHGGAFHGDSVYFTTGEPFRVVVLDLEDQSWRLLEAEVPPLAFARVVSSGQRLYLVGGVGENGIARGVRVWELVSGGGGVWVEVGRLPELMWRKVAAVCFHKYEHLCCLWVEGALCVGCVTWPEVLQWRVGRGTWHWLPVCPMLPEKWSCGFRWFSFATDLYAMV